MNAIFRSLQKKVLDQRYYSQKINEYTDDNL